MLAHHGKNSFYTLNSFPESLLQQKVLMPHPAKQCKLLVSITALTWEAADLMVRQGDLHLSDEAELGLLGKHCRWEVVTGCKTMMFTHPSLPFSLFTVELIYAEGMKAGCSELSAHTIPKPMNQSITASPKHKHKISQTSSIFQL